VAALSAFTSVFTNVEANMEGVHGTTAKVKRVVYETSKGQPALRRRVAQGGSLK